jgi:hypothetical protein
MYLEKGWENGEKKKKGDIRREFDSWKPAMRLPWRDMHTSLHGSMHRMQRVQLPAGARNLLGLLGIVSLLKD